MADTLEVWAVAANNKPQPIQPWDLPKALTHRVIDDDDPRDDEDL